MCTLLFKNAWLRINGPQLFPGHPFCQPRLSDFYLVAVCCIFPPAFGCCALQTLVEISIYCVFLHVFQDCFAKLIKNEHFLAYSQTLFDKKNLVQHPRKQAKSSFQIKKCYEKTKKEQEIIFDLFYFLIKKNLDRKIKAMVCYISKWID